MPRKPSSTVEHTATGEPGGGPTGGEFIAAFPTTPQELQAAWGIPTEWVAQTTVKTTRLVRGSAVWALLSSDPLERWSLDLVANRFGPGTYRIVCGNGPSRLKNSTIHVSPEFAELAGFASAPAQPLPPDPLQLQATRTFERAQVGPVDRVELAAMIQTAINQARPQESGLDSFMKGFSAANDLSLRAIEQAKAMLGMNPTAAEPKEATWADVVLQVAPTILEGFKAIMTQPAPQAQPQPQPQSQPVTHAALAMNPPEAQSMAQAPQFPVPPEETRPLINLMRQYAPYLKGHLEGTATPKELAEQLASLVGPALDPSVIATAAHVQTAGPGILGNIAPFFATEKAAQVITEWSRIIQQEQG